VAILQECEVIAPQNFSKLNFKLFDKVLTWSKTVLLEEDNAVQMPTIFAYTQNSLNNFQKLHKKKRKKLCVLIASNKKSKHLLELYSKRRSLIEWFDSKHPNEFDLYGYDWDRRYFKYPNPLTFLNRFEFITKKSNPYRCYQGEVDSKINTLSNYKFSICFENARSISGYITEKIFDSMISGAVPIYFGDPDIEKYIPNKCFIRYDRFKNNDELFFYIKNMPDYEYEEYRRSIKKFLTGNDIHFFSNLFFAKIFSNILENE
jgi:hypothetical protein